MNTSNFLLANDLPITLIVNVYFGNSYVQSLGLSHVQPVAPINIANPGTSYTLVFPRSTGNPRLRLRPEGTAEATPEALQSANPGCGDADPVPVEVSRGRQVRQQRGHVEHLRQRQHASGTAFDAAWQGMCALWFPISVSGLLL